MSSDLTNATFSSATGIVIGFDMSGTTLPAGDGVLATVSFVPVNEAGVLDVGSVTVSSGGGVTLASGGPGSSSFDGCYETDCAGDCYGSSVVDECNVCNGDGIADGACDCDGNVEDCAGDCGGSAVEDECGVCDGDNSSCSGCTDIFGLNYDSDASLDDNSCTYADYQVEAGMFYYSPSDLQIEPGESVQWNNLSGFHDVVAVSGPE